MKSETVYSILEKIDSKEILLPAMQRKFVWSEEKIIALFDSMMKGYPFGVFIFWDINNKADIKKYTFYQFIKDYSKRDETINAPAGRIGKDVISVVMDGQQRLTSFYIGIKGSLTTIDKWKKAKIAENWKKKHLYFVPHLKEEERNNNEAPFRFLFLEDSYVEKQNELRSIEEKYRLVSDLYHVTKSELKKEYGIKNTKDKSIENWYVVLERLRYLINDAKILNYHSIIDTNLEDVLEIFIRINNGGTELSPSNLLFSTVISSWEKGRDEMDEFIKTINEENVINLKEDFLIRTCVYLMNCPAATKLEVLTKDVVKKIETNWDKIKAAIINTKNFLKRNNIYNEAIISYNVLLPIIYFYYHKKKCSDKNLEKSEQQLLYFFAISQMFSLFGGSSSSTLESVRKKMCLNDKLGKIKIPFNIRDLFDIDLSAGRIHAFRISQEQVERLVDETRYGDKKSFALLSLLQPNITLNANSYDVDHVCSKDELKAVFKLRRKEKRADLEKKKNTIPNLQLLAYNQNRGEKNADSLYTWIVEKGNKIEFDPYEKDKNKEKYRISSIEKFEEFYAERRKLIIIYLCECFGIDNCSYSKNIKQQLKAKRKD